MISLILHVAEKYLTLPGRERPKAVTRQEKLLDPLSLLLSLLLLSSSYSSSSDSGQKETVDR